MRSAIAVSAIVRRKNRPVRGCVTRIGFGAFVLVGVLTTTARAAVAQAPAQVAAEATRRWELVLPSGTMVPTGSQGDAIKRGGLTALQLSYVVDPALALTATVGWTRSRDIASEGNPKLDLFTYDVGAEVRAPRWLSRGRVSFTPFAGLGAGARSYNYRSLDVDATHNLAAYGSIGGDVGIGRVHVRVEARDYVSGFKPLDGAGDTDTRNDVALLFGLRYVRR